MPKRWFDPAFFTDEKMKRATVPERLLAAAIIANQDDDGRLRGDPAYLRAITFLYDDYSLEEVKAMRDHLAEVNPNIIVYKNAGDEYIQLRHHRRYQKPRYYHPSKFPAPPGWPFEEELPASNQKETEQQPSDNHLVTKEHTEGKGKGNNLDLDKGKGIGIGRGMAAQTPSPSTRAPPSEIQILHRLTECFKREWGRVKAEALDKVIPREPTAKESAQLRDLARELSSAGGCPLETIDEAFRDVAGQPQPKMHISYVRKVLRAWLGLERGPPG
ncbi:hypothetical protein ES703_120078 [subsurface metagenome]